MGFCRVLLNGTNVQLNSDNCNRGSKLFSKNYRGFSELFVQGNGKLGVIRALIRIVYEIN